MDRKYSPINNLDIEDVDLDDDTSTACSEKYQPIDTSNKIHQSHKQISRDQNACLLKWLRWGVVVVLQGIIILLLLVRSPTTSGNAKDTTETGGDINGLYLPTSHDYRELIMEPTRYVPNMTSDANRMEVRQNWDKLMPLGSGTVSIPNWREYPLLGAPIIDDPIRSGPIFEASWTHALHCLYYTVDTYHQLLLHGRNGEENPHHATHCFEYLRNNILCSMDMTLEGDGSVNGGQAHVCRNRAEAVRWIEERRVDDMQDIVGP